MSSNHSLLVQAVLQPASVAFLERGGWDLLIRQARRADLLAWLSAWLEGQRLVPRVPPPAWDHLDSARIAADKHAKAVHWEVRCIRHALRNVDLPVVLLKGAAYVMAGLPPGRGRLFYDVDILVPKARLAEVERALRRHGWSFLHLDAYDQRYYRTWMHELPPLQHLRRGTVIDVHHRILPETARLRPDPEKMLAKSKPIAGFDGIHTLAPAHMVLHSAAHLFHDGELEHGLRDLIDLDALIRHFTDDPSFWDELLDSARELELMRPLYYALRYTNRILATPVPEEILVASRDGAPAGAGRVLVDQLFLRGLLPDHETCNDRLSGAARWILYVRSHYLRMPLRLLIPHLVRKAVRRRLNLGEHR